MEPYKKKEIGSWQVSAPTPSSQNQGAGVWSRDCEPEPKRLQKLENSERSRVLSCSPAPLPIDMDIDLVICFSHYIKIETTFAELMKNNFEWEPGASPGSGRREVISLKFTLHTGSLSALVLKFNNFIWHRLYATV